MAFLEDPRLRQRWNQIAHDAEAATENAAAGIWSFQQHYVNPCLGSLAASIEQCTAVCLGDAEERRRRQRERAHSRAENIFDFYDDWYEEEEQSGGLLAGWGGEDWDRLLAGTGSQKKHGGVETAEQPRRKRGMSYGTRGGRRKTVGQDPTIIPSTQPIGLLSKLPWKMGGTLRYKPSAADLQEHPGRHDGESEPLLGSGDAPDGDQILSPRKRSGTTGSGDTTDSYRSRGDLFPSDGEGDEDAVPLDDDVTYDMIRKGDRSSLGGRSSKGKRPASGAFAASRTVSRSTLGSLGSRESSIGALRASVGSLPATPDIENAPSLEDLAMEETKLRQEEDEKLAKQKEAATQLAAARGLGMDGSITKPATGQVKSDLEVTHPGVDQPETNAPGPPPPSNTDQSGPRPDIPDASNQRQVDSFVPAKLPVFR